MRRVSVGILLFLLLSMMETSFVASLPAPFAFLPLVLAVALYVLQHHGIRVAAWWIWGYGIWLDVTGLGLVQGETILYAVTTGWALLAARHLFTNRSWYGVLVFGLTVFLLQRLLEFGVLFFLHLTGKGAPLFSPELWTLSWIQGLLLLLLLTLFFFSSNQWKSVLRLLKMAPS